jgi:hypothetical protein
MDDYDASFIEIDGHRYNVKVKAGVKRTADFLFKTAKRLQSGTLDAELIGVYYNFSNLQFEKQTDANYNDYNALYDRLTQPTEFHTLKVGNYTFIGYCNSINDEIYLWKNGKPYYRNLSVALTSKNPARR